MGTVQFSGGNLYDFNGSFAFDATGNLTGNILNSVNITQGGVATTSITSIGTNPAATQPQVDGGNEAGFMAIFLAGNDSVTGSAGVNALGGFGGNDTIDALGGNDTVFGDNGVDSLLAGDGDDLVYGGVGLVSAEDSADTIFGGLGIDSIYGNAGDDLVVGGRLLADTLDGADYLHGGRGNDSMYGNTGNDTLFGGEGNDTMFGGGGDDLFYGGWAIFDPTDTADQMFGNDGNDQLYSNGGNDTISGGNGNDTMHAGVGNDTYRFEMFDTGADTILQFENPGVGAGDLLVFTDSTLIINTTAASLLALVNYANGNATLNLSLIGSPLSMTIMGVAPNSLTVDDFSFV